MKRKLTIELVPQSLWGKSLANNLPRREWQRIRSIILTHQDNECSICGKEGVTLQCHEIWKYDDEHHIQSLAGFVALCHLCHEVKHYGRSRIKAREGKLDIEKINEHYCDINGCFLRDLEWDYREEWRVWKERSSHTDWTQVTDNYEQFL